MKPMIILCDLGRIRAFRVHAAGLGPRESLHLSEILVDSSRLHRLHLRELVTGPAGGFPRGGPAGRPGAMARGEPHQLEDELERQSVERLARRIGAVLEQEHYPPWRLVAPASLGPRLRPCLSPPARKALTGVETGDLTGMTLAHLEQLLL